MPYPTRLLDQGEDLVADLRPHWSLMARPLALTVLAAAGAVAAMASGGVPATALEALLALILAALAWVGVRYTRWATTSFVVTTRRIVLRQGVLGRRGREILLSRVADLSYRQTLAQRVLGCGTLQVESGGEQGMEVMPRVPRPAAVQRLVSTQIDLARLPGPERAGGAVLSIPEQIEKLDDLRRRGIISQSELDTKRAQLLERW